MKICCPDCGFTREMAEDRIPAGRLVATCPGCGCRFRFSKEEGVLETVSKGRRPAKGDDALPPGAVVHPLLSPEELARRSEAAAAASESSSQADEAQKAESASAHAAERRPEQPKQAQSGEPLRNEWEKPDAEPRYQGPEMWGRLPDAEESRRSGEPFNPWQTAPAPSGYLSAFYQTCIRMMFAPARFGASLETAPLVKPLIFYLVLCVIQTVVERTWIELFLGYITPLAGSDPQFSKLIELLSQQENVVLSVLLRAGMVTAQLFFFAGILNLLVRAVTRGRGDYSKVFQVLAYAEAPGILCLVPFIGSIVGFAWGIGCMVQGLRAAFRLNLAQTVAAFLPVICLMLPLFMNMVAFLKG